MRVMSAVATAGGYTYRANQNYVVVTRNGQERRALPNTPIEPDDVIKVPERYF
jgi:polysaccharide export outer membrane protein